MDWTDNYTENFEGSEKAAEAEPEARNAFNSIVNLWTEYANMEKSLRQWKKALQVFEDAVNDQIASKSALIYIAFADFYKDRGKMPNAQKVYLRALGNSQLSQEDIDKVWLEYLETMRAIGNSKQLTLDQLHFAVSKQIDTKALIPPSENALSASRASAEVDEPDKKRSKVETESEPASLESTMQASSPATSTLPETTPAVNGEVRQSAEMMPTGKPPALEETRSRKDELNETPKSVEAAPVPASAPASTKVDSVLASGPGRSDSSLLTRAGPLEGKENSKASVQSAPVASQRPIAYPVHRLPAQAAAASPSNILPGFDIEDIGGLEPEALLLGYWIRPPILFCAPDIVRIPIGSAYTLNL